MIFSSRADSLTVDEKVHISAGYLHVWRGNYTFNAEHPPLLNDLAGLFAKIARPNLPNEPVETFIGSDQWDYGDLFFYRAGNDVEKIIFWARFPFMLLTLGLIYLVFLWAKALFGKKAGLLAATLMAFSPSFLAHGRLATTDLGLVFFFVLTVWLLRKYILRPTWLSAAVLGLSIGLTILTKFSAPFVLPVVISGLIYVWLKKKRTFWVYFGQLVVMILISLTIIWLVYIFSMRADLSKISDVYQLSKSLGGRTIINHTLQIFAAPFDKYFQGYEIVSQHNQAGHWNYLNGQIGYRGWWYYFPLVLLYKLTLPTLILFFFSLMAFFKYRKSPIEEFLIIFPALLFFLVAMTSTIDIGIRHILVVLPFLYIFLSRVVLIKNVAIKPLVAILVLAQIMIAGLSYPNYIAYFNQLAGGPKNGIKYLADSNLDWNQNMKRFGAYAKENKIDKVYELCWDQTSFEYYGVKTEILPNTPVNGVVVICAQQLVVPPDGFDFSWVTKYPPDDVISNGMYIWRFDKKNVQ